MFGYGGHISSSPEPYAYNRDDLTVILNVTNSCNFCCTYCYYQSSMHKSPEDMSDDIVEQTVKSVADSPYKDVRFIFHGGEPLLRPLGFYQKFIALENRYCRNKNITNCLQTNGSLINRDILKFFAATHTGNKTFQIGISIDGPDFIHDAHRIHKSGNATWPRVMEAAELLQSQGIMFGVLSVYTDIMADNVHAVYNFFSTLKGMKTLNFLPAHLIEKETCRRFSDFSQSLFECWVKDRHCSFDIIYLSNIIRSLHNLATKGKLCTYMFDCFKNSNVISIESNGEVSVCDSFNKITIGDIAKQSIIELMWPLNRQRRELSSIYRTKTQKCLFCRWWKLCYAGCPADIDELRQRYCADFKKIFKLISDRLPPQNNHDTGNNLERDGEIQNPLVRRLINFT